MDGSAHFPRATEGAVERLNSLQPRAPPDRPAVLGGAIASQYSGMTPVQLGAWTPCTKEGSQVGARGDTVTVEVRAAT